MENEPVMKNEKLFAEQWKEVEKKYPMVAARYLEMVEILIEQGYRGMKFYRDAVSKINILDPDSPIQVSTVFTDMVSTLNEVEIKDPPRCRPAINVADIERYVKCLVERLSAMSS